MLELKNASDNDLVALLTLNVPECLEVEVFSDENLSGNNVGNPVRIGPNTWKFKVEAAADCTDDANDVLYIVISADDWCQPGYFNMSGTLKQIAY